MAAIAFDGEVKRMGKKLNPTYYIRVPITYVHDRHLTPGAKLRVNVETFNNDLSGHGATPPNLDGGSSLLEFFEPLPLAAVL